MISPDFSKAFDPGRISFWEITEEGRLADIDVRVIRVVVGQFDGEVSINALEDKDFRGAFAADFPVAVVEEELVDAANAVLVGLVLLAGEGLGVALVVAAARVAADAGEAVERLVAGGKELFHGLGIQLAVHVAHHEDRAAAGEDGVVRLGHHLADLGDTGLVASGLGLFTLPPEVGVDDHEFLSVLIQGENRRIVGLGALVAPGGGFVLVVSGFLKGHGLGVVEDQYWSIFGPYSCSVTMSGRKAQTTSSRPRARTGSEQSAPSAAHPGAFTSLP